MWEGRDPHMGISSLGHDMVAQFLGVTSGWAGVTITKFSEGLGHSTRSSNLGCSESGAIWDLSGGF